MLLDPFDQEVLAYPGNSESLITELYHKKLGKANSAKYASAIRMHLNFKRKFIDDKQFGSLNERTVNSLGVVTTKRMVILSESESQDPYRIMSVMGFDPIQWKLERYKIRRTDWDVTMKLRTYDPDLDITIENPHRETNHAFMVELTVKPVQKILESGFIKEVLEEVIPRELPEYQYQFESNSLLEIAIMDLHLGKIVDEDRAFSAYDLNIAKRNYYETFLDLLAKSRKISQNYDQILVPLGQDFFNIDTAKLTTTKGTPQASDPRWHLMYRTGVDMLVNVVETLRQYGPVHLIHIGGNHDQVMSYSAAYTLYKLYENVKGVTCDVSAADRKYYEYGNTLLGFSHGEEPKTRIEHLMQQEASEAWGRTIFREFHLGHTHHEECNEVGGVKLRRLPSITGVDGWHSRKGFSSIRMAQAFIWDKTLGKQFTIDSNILEKPHEDVT